MSKFWNVMEWIGASIGCASIGAITTTGIYTGVEYGTSACMGKSSTETQRVSVELGNGNSLLGTVGAGTIGVLMTTVGNSFDDSSPEPDTVIKRMDNNEYARIEARAQMIYDNLNKNHYESYKPSIILANTPKDAESVKNILNSFESKEDLYIYLTALQMAIEKDENQSNLTKKLKR